MSIKNNIDSEIEHHANSEEFLKYARKPLFVPVRLSSAKHSAGFRVWSRDISYRGMFLVSNNIYEIGEVFELDFTLPEPKQTIHVKGKVIWVSRGISQPNILPRGMGIEFTDITEQDKELINKYITGR